MRRTKEPLINAWVASARFEGRSCKAGRGPRGMAVALAKSRNAVDAAFRARPSGLSKLPTL
ncbi:hypothetical protein [Hydrocarboniclastica marina]|uniref:Uncharacterized protein n=1 Tax=Hydrocarboniclastica marina TaxID=2259620 RepID=A0A4P7XJT3_9ALTE|nr:hypothetical protein [Hydrocarboniclastica marina]QCF26642.1 hypothetical protein soil367_12260 [Hydrocarboniclastica marina]